MDALIDLALNHGPLGALIILLVVSGFVAYKMWRDLVAERNFYRDALIKALQAGESLAGRDSGGEGGNG